MNTLLLVFALGLAALPPLTAVSRRWERSADRYALELTNEPAAYERVFRRLAATNLSDLDPPRLVYALLFFIVLAVPATAARFTPPGRVLMDHQTDLVLIGVAILLITALLFAVTGTG